MLGTKVLLILAPILLVEAQSSSPRPSNGFSRGIPFRRPFVRPRPEPVVTSVPNIPKPTEKIETITVPQPSITHPIEEDNIPPQSAGLTIIYPENYKPATSSPPEPSSRLRIPIRLPSFPPRPVESTHVAPTTVLPPPPTQSHFNFMPRFPTYVTSQPATIPESAKPVDIVAEESAPTESILSQSTEKLPKFSSFESNEPVNKPVLTSLEPIVQPTERIPEPSETEPIEPAPKPLEPILKPSVSVPEPIESVPESINSIPETIESVPEPINSVPEPIESVPEPSETVPTPSLETFEPPVPSVSMPINWRPIVTVEPAPPATIHQPTIVLPPASITVKPIEYRQPEIIPTKPSTIIKPVSVAPSDIPKEVPPVDDSVKPFMDVVNPPVSESGPPIVVENNPTYNKPMIHLYSAQQKPKPTLAVPSANVIYSYKPTATANKPIVRPVSTAKPWSQPSVDLYSYVNRLHNYSCRSSDGYESVLNQCDAYVECKQNMAFHYICPDGLHFNSAAKWPEYPCGYPSEVKCESQAFIQEPRPTGQCPHRYGFYPIPDGDCGQYIMCQEGLATIMSCPPGLAFSSITNSCDWPANVPGCNPNIFQGFTCPAPSLDKYGKQINNNSKYRYKNSCNQYIACYKGKPRLLSCDAGTSFDAGSGTCVDTDQVVDCQY